MTDSPAVEILVGGARALAHADGLGPSLQALLDIVAGQLGVQSAVIFVASPGGDHLERAATVELSEPAASGLDAAVRNPAHPIARTVVDRTAAFDVLPTAPGGPALRSHLPLIVTRNGSDVVLGVLALAHERSIGPSMRPLLGAAADLAAVAIERSRATPA